MSDVNRSDPGEAIGPEPGADKEALARTDDDANDVTVDAAPVAPEADNGTAAGTEDDTEAVQETNETKLLPLIVQIAEEHNLYFDSLLDVGCGMRPLDQWFRRFKRSEAPRRFIGIDPNAAAIEALVNRGQMAFTGFNARFDTSSDLVIAADVLEYLSPSAAGSFVNKCASLTSKLFALSTVNARHWGRTGIRPQFQAIKWVPASVYECFRDGDGFGRIRNPMSAGQVAGLMRAAFDPERWDLVVYQAWPWEVRDLTTDTVARFCLKTFALAIAKDNRR